MPCREWKAPASGGLAGAYLTSVRCDGEHLDDTPTIIEFQKRWLRRRHASAPNRAALVSFLCFAGGAQ